MIRYVYMYVVAIADQGTCVLFGRPSRPQLLTVRAAQDASKRAAPLAPLMARPGGSVTSVQLEIPLENRSLADLGRDFHFLALPDERDLDRLADLQRPDGGCRVIQGL